MLVVHSAVHRHDLRLGFWAGLVGAVKIVPILVLPIIVVAAAIRAPRRLARIALGTLLGLGLGLGPMIALSPRALPLILAYHGKRGLQVESSLGVLYGAAKAILGDREAAKMSFGSFNFHTATSDTLARLALPLTLALVAVVFVVFLRRTPAALVAHEADEEIAARTERIALAMLATLVALWLGGKVFSPQYLTWAIPDRALRPRSPRHAARAHARCGSRREPALPARLLRSRLQPVAGRDRDDARAPRRARHDVRVAAPASRATAAAAVIAAKPTTVQ